MSEINSPLTKEDWDKIADVELEKTNRVWFKTPSGKSVEFIPVSVIDDIKAEIEKEIIPRNSDQYDNEVKWQNMGLRMALKVIDRYKAESEE